MPGPGPRDLVAIGTVVKPHGLRGEVSVEVLTDFPSRFTEGLKLVLRSPSGEVREARIATVRPHGGRVLVRFEGVEDPAGAEALRGLDLCVGQDEPVERPPGYVFHYEVEGCRAVDVTGQELGIVRALVDLGGRPLLVVATEAGEREVPFSAPIVVSVDLARKTVVLDPPRGLLD